MAGSYFRRRKMRLKGYLYKKLIFTSFICAASAISLAGCGLFPKEEVFETTALVQEAEEPEFSMTTVKRGDICEFNKINCEYSESNIQEVILDEWVRIEKVCVSEGDEVHEGDVLVKVAYDEEEQEISVEECEYKIKLKKEQIKKTKIMEKLELKKQKLIMDDETALRAIRERYDAERSGYNTELELLYIDDLVEGMFDLLEGKEQHCEFDGVNTVLKNDGRYCCVPVTHKVTLGEIVDLLQQFKAQPSTLMIPKMPDGSFAKKLYSLYLTYLPKEKFKYELKMNIDNRGSFTELVHTADCGQVSINISRPGIIKGQHWHNSKWELFIVVTGHGLIQERNINTGEMVEFEVSGDKIEAVHMIPGWTHNIINLSETENLVTVMTCNEIFNPNRPDTFFEPVVK